MADGQTKLASIGSMQKGRYIVIDGAACVVTDVQTSRPGKHGHAKVRLSATGILDNKKRVIVMPGHDQVPVPIIDKKNAQVLSVAGTKATLMDSETYETFELEIPEELKDNCVAGVTVLYWVILADKVMKQVKTE
ncbi:translation initiation factor IF-5A [Candidatus Woesearchaeota archaeon CG_4_10_14_0_8_um_filter_47_5]|nr:MAG: translation initiation factor IF-5A [Candidatus Woesearchaeota archaeon CG_4_10_14_0_8_um_filter_47_5]